jgi:hypothetical protein
MFKVTLKEILDWLRKARQKAQDLLNSLPNLFDNTTVRLAATVDGIGQSSMFQMGEDDDALESDADWEYETEPVE